MANNGQRQAAVVWGKTFCCLHERVEGAQNNLGYD